MTRGSLDDLGAWRRKGSGWWSEQSHGPISQLASKKGSSQSTMRLLWSHCFLCFRCSSPHPSLPGISSFPLRFSVHVSFAKPLTFPQKTDHVPLCPHKHYRYCDCHVALQLGALSRQIRRSAKAGTVAYSFFYSHFWFFSQCLALTRACSVSYIYCICIETTFKGLC